MIASSEPRRRSTVPSISLDKSDLQAIAVLISDAPARIAETADAQDIPISSETRIPSETPSSEGTLSRTFVSSAANSVGSICPASSQRVTVVAPASMATAMALVKNCGSVRVASRMTNSTSAQRARQSVTCALINSSMAGAFLWQTYSICAGERGRTTCKRGFGALFNALNAMSTSSAVIPVGNAKMLSVTTEAQDLTSRVSTVSFSIRGSSMTEVCSLSSNFTISIFSLKVRGFSVERCIFSVTSEIIMLFIMIYLSSRIVDCTQPSGISRAVR